VIHVGIENFLGPVLAAKLLEHCIASESVFGASTVGAGGDVKSTVRQSRRLEDLGTLRGAIERRVALHAPWAIKQLGITAYPVKGLELELVAHEEGAFYKRHIDLFTGRDRSEGQDRFLTVVCYLHREPKAFEGGELRLFEGLPSRLPEEDRFIDIEPGHDLAIAFSSWLPHEVRPVRCPSLSFADARFALNCWLLRDRNDAALAAELA
jgi:SM-20-related protein